MAGRISQAIVQVLSTGDPSARISHSIVQVLSTGDPSARISHSIVQVLSQRIIYPDVSDDLNNWADSVEIWSPNNQNFSDDLDNWTDLLERYYGIVIVNLTISVEDWLSKAQFTGKALKDSWKDGVEYILEGADVGLFISIEDLDQFSDDELALGFGISLSDDLDNWLDAVSQARSYQRQAYDSMQYNMLDDIQISYLLSQSPSDDLDNWNDSDEESKNNAVNKTGDQIIFSDELSMIMKGYLSLDDSFSLSDSLGIYVNTINAFADDLNNLTDDVALNTIVNLTLTVGDDLDNLSDAIDEDNDLLLAGSDIGYLRRYLNDVI